MRVHIRRESEMGRYHAMNLLTAEWVETMLNCHATEIKQIYRDIRDNFLLQPIY